MKPIVLIGVSRVTLRDETKKEDRVLDNSKLFSYDYALTAIAVFYISLRNLDVSFSFSLHDDEEEEAEDVTYIVPGFCARRLDVFVMIEFFIDFVWYLSSSCIIPHRIHEKLLFTCFVQCC
jgi:hypothetical protein